MLLWSKSAAQGYRHALAGYAQHPSYRRMLWTVFSYSRHAQPLPANFSQTVFSFALYFLYLFLAILNTSILRRSIDCWGYTCWMRCSMTVVGKSNRGQFLGHHLGKNVRGLREITNEFFQNSFFDSLHMPVVLILIYLKYKWMSPSWAWHLRY